LKRHHVLGHKESLRKRYDKEYVCYDETRSPWLSGYVGTVEQGIILSSLKRNTILEVGTGTGRYAALLNDRNYVGIDLSHNMLDKAKERTSSVYICADGENLPFQDGTFDSVICSRTFRFIPNPLKALKEARRVLRKGGRCIISVDFLRDFYGYRIAQSVFGKFPYETHYRVDEMLDLYRNAGFRIIRQEMPFSLPETFYRRVPHSLWKIVRLVDRRLERWLRGWFLIIVGEVEN
jgi:ubiquinone/menaquinone biosynthesis C-methylase UbiE